MELQNGSYIGGYCVTRLIGRGAMGGVYLCENPRIGSQVAIKVMHSRHERSDWVVDRFISEARVVNQIGHPGIVRIFDCRMESGIGPYLVMEYLEGQNLKQHCKGQLPLSEIDAAQILLQAASAVSACHRSGIVHRDLKPANLFLQDDPGMPEGFRVKVLDFGVAKLLNAEIRSKVKTLAGMVPGSPPYMSPESMVDARSIDARSDIYSLGVIGYHLLTGRYPHEANSLGRLVIMRQEEDPVPPRTYNSEISPAVEQVLLGALEREPDRRYQSIESFRMDLCDVAFQERLSTVTWSRSITPPPTQREIGAALLPAADTADTVVDMQPPEHAPPAPPSPLAPSVTLRQVARQPALDNAPEAPATPRPTRTTRGGYQPLGFPAVKPPPARRRSASAVAIIGAAATLLLAAMLIGSYSLF